jgi:hypothetical protein
MPPPGRLRQEASWMTRGQLGPHGESLSQKQHKTKQMRQRNKILNKKKRLKK